MTAALQIVAARRLPLVVPITAVTCALVVGIEGVGDELVLELPFVAALIALAAIDFDHGILPNRIVYPLAAWGLIGTLLVDRGELTENLVTGAASFTVLLVLALANPRGMGLGDVKLAGAMGLFLGLSIIPALVVAFLSGGVAGLAIIAREGAAARSRAMPFGVFLMLGGIAALLAGPELIDIYEDNFLAARQAPGSAGRAAIF